MQSTADEDYADLFDEIEADLDSEKDASETEQEAATDDDYLFGLEEDFELSLASEHKSSLRFSYIDEYMNFDEYYRAPKVENTIELDIQYKGLRLISDWKLDLILNRDSSINRVIQAAPLENALFLEQRRFTFSFAYQLFNWGTADSINPTDNLNPRDYTKGPEPEKLPVFSFAVNYFPVNEVSLEAVYIPFQAGPIFGNSAVDFLEAQFPSTQVSSNSLEFEPKNFVIGTKASFYLPALDFSLGYIYNFTQASLPVISTTPYGSIYIPDRIDLNRKRVHQLGFDLRTSIGRFGLWNETGISLVKGYKQDTYELTHPQLNWVIGTDFNYGPNNEHYMNAQYLGFYTFNYDDEFYSDYSDGSPETGMGEAYYSDYYNRLLNNSSAGISEGLLQGLSLRFDWDFADSFIRPSFTAAYFFPLIYNDKIMENGNPVSYKRLGGMIAQASIDFMPIDSFHIVIGAELYMSLSRIDGSIEIDETDRFGSNYKYSTTYVEVSYKWGIDYKK